MTTAGDGQRLTHKQAVERVLNDPATAARIASLPGVAEKRQLYGSAEAGVLAELAEAGFAVGEVRQLRQLKNYRAAVPVLLRWLPRMSLLRPAENIVYVLSVRFAARQAFPVFAELFRNPPEVTDPWWPPTSKPEREYLRWNLGCGLAVFAGPEYADELIELAADRSYGRNRALIVTALPKTKDPRVPGVLLGLLDDPPVRADAIEAVGLMRFVPARDLVAGLCGDPDENMRRQAKKALKRIDQSLKH
jgi:hypothetical protein